MTTANYRNINLDEENTPKANKGVVVKLFDYFLMVIKKPSFFISIFIIFELFPILGHKIASNLTEEKKNLS